MWLANFEDGSSVGGIQCHWTDLPAGKKITGVQIANPEYPKMFVSLKNYHRYYFMHEAIASPGDVQGRVTAEILGGHDLDLQVGTEIRVEVSGSVKVRTYPLGKFRFSQVILREGKKNGKPQIDTEHT